MEEKTKIFGTLSKRETAVFRRLSNPKKIQNFLEVLPINFEENGDTLYSPRTVLEKNKCHCFEGALFAAAVLWYHGHEPILLDLVTEYGDESHVVALFKQNGKWGAVSKTNHAVLRYRDPLYSSPKELAMSYFHEYFLDNGRKTLRSFGVFNLKKIKRNWVTDPRGVWYVDKALDHLKHTPILSSIEVKNLRLADPVERRAGKLVVWKKRRT